MVIGATVRRTEVAPDRWEPEETTWLCEMKCEDAANKLKTNGINGDYFFLFEVQDFIEMHVNFGRRKKILDAIKKHQSGDKRSV